MSDPRTIDDATCEAARSAVQGLQGVEAAGQYEPSWRAQEMAKALAEQQGFATGLHPFGISHQITSPEAQVRMKAFDAAIGAYYSKGGFTEPVEIVAAAKLFEAYLSGKA